MSSLLDNFHFARLPAQAEAFRAEVRAWLTANVPSEHSARL